eukprot:2939548-Rhodomonas_salina.1
MPTLPGMGMGGAARRRLAGRAVASSLASILETSTQTSQDPGWHRQDLLAMWVPPLRTDVQT